MYVVDPRRMRASACVWTPRWDLHRQVPERSAHEAGHAQLVVCDVALKTLCGSWICIVPQIEIFPPILFVVLIGKLR